VQANSNWAIDEENLRVFVCGDLGRAILYDIDMGARAQLAGLGRNATLSVPKSHKEWKIQQYWFTAHQISKNDVYFVNTVKFCKAAGLFITGSSNGEIKLWSAIDCKAVGLLNAKQWISGDVTSHIEKWNEADKGKK
jgi:WD40 repeat protein